MIRSVTLAKAYLRLLGQGKMQRIGSPILSACYSSGKSENDPYPAESTIPVQKSSIQANDGSSDLAQENLKKIDSDTPSPSLRIQQAIFMHQLLPSFRQQLLSLPFLSPLTTYNPALTTGGDDFAQFPLIKLLHIATRYSQEGMDDIQTWRRLEYSIRGRMHRCGIEEHLRLLYVMLEVYPIFRFKFEFIMSVCTALKKQTPIMTSEQLAALYCIVATNLEHKGRLSNSILLTIQGAVIGRMLAKIEINDKNAQKSAKAHLPIEHLYLWMTLTMSLSLRNSYFELQFDQKTVRILTEFTKRWKELTTRQQRAKIPSKYHFLLTIQILAMIEPLLVTRKIRPKNDFNNKDQEVNVVSQLRLTKQTILSHCSKIISLLLNQPPNTESLTAYSALTSLYPIQSLLSTFLKEQEGSQNHKGSLLHSQLAGLINIEAQYGMSVHKVGLLTKLFNHGIIDEFMTRSLYESIDLTLTQPSLEMVYQLLTIELYLFEARGRLQPRKEAQKMIVDYLEQMERPFRHFDWLAFSFIRLLLVRQTKSQEGMINSNLPVDRDYDSWKTTPEERRLWRILGSLVEMTKIEKTTDLINSQSANIEALQTVKEVSKFFIQIQVHEMKQNQAIVPPFRRLVHFANISDKIAVNAYTATELRLKEVQLERTLLMGMGWRVINLDSSKFMQLSLNQRLQFLTTSFQDQKRLIEGGSRRAEWVELLG